MLAMITGAAHLPSEDGAFTVAGQEWPWKPGPRDVPCAVYYPGGALAGVSAQTGLMLSLHNWGGTGATGTADPAALAERYNVVAITVDYLKSGPYAAREDPPYNFGYLQALDALRALRGGYLGLESAGVDFAKDRIYTCGGSGGGNVSLMAAKLAPRTFAVVVDMSGMARLSDDIAYGLEGGSSLDAGYSRDPEEPRYLAPDAQVLRDVAYEPHLAVAKDLGTKTQYVCVHGRDDVVCPFADKQRMTEAFKAAGLVVDAHFIADADVDGEVVKDTGHSVGDRTRMVFRFADRYLDVDSPEMRRLEGPPDFVRGGEVRLPTPTGAYVIDHSAPVGPTGRFEPARRERDE